jgi:hypothetical protein
MGYATYNEREVKMNGEYRRISKEIIVTYMNMGRLRKPRKSSGPDQPAARPRFEPDASQIQI